MSKGFLKFIDITLLFWLMLLSHVTYIKKF